MRDVVNLPGLSVIVPGVSTHSDLRPTPGPVTDGGFPAEIWARARQADNAFASVHMTASAGLVKTWVDLAQAALEPCWTDTEPAARSAR